MNTQNVNIAASEASKTWNEYPKILLAEGSKAGDHADFEIYEFSSLKKLKEFRKCYPEKMNEAYSYAVSTGTQRDGRHICPVSAAHYKKFIKLAKAAGFDF